MTFAEQRMNIKFCVRFEKNATETYKMTKRMHIMLLSGNDASGKAGKVSKSTNTMDVRRLPATLITLKRFLRWYVGTGFKQLLGENENNYFDISFLFYSSRSL
ncbi:hypothetical protein TNCV_5060721 [Trichonephila clavipes]|nr:hypothetical protein TNCV_5060721 [Trichonephila clavipes]